MGIKVSVVVPVYNPGPYLQRGVDSLLAQTLPTAELELIFVDDGSTDEETPRLLHDLESAHPHVRVLRIPNSGWPGKPRNVGTDAASGEYVMYVDQDDALEPQSLERMYALGAVNGADVILGKVISDFRGVHHNLYREQRPCCDVFSADLMYSLTPHKMLRTAFLRQEGIRYPEGPRRLEDQLFMTKAYFAAKRATIVADYVCYRYLRRQDGKNAGSKRIDPVGYYSNLRDVLDAVDAHTGVGARRDGFYRRFLRTEMLGRLGGSEVMKFPAKYLVTLHRELRALLQERFPVAVDEGLGVALRGQAALLRFGTIHEIAEQASAVDSIRATARLTGLRQVDGRVVELDIEGRLLAGDQPLRLEPSSRGWLLPRSITGPALPDAQRVIEDLAEMSGEVVIQHRRTLDEWFVPGQLRARLDSRGDSGELIWSGTAAVDPLTAAGGAPLRAGLHDFTVRLQGLGLTRNKRLGSDRSPDVRALPLLLDRTGRINRIYDTALGNLSFNVDAREHWLNTALQEARFVDTTDGSVVLDLGVIWEQPPTGGALTLSLPDGASVEWSLVPLERGGTRWVAAPGPSRLTMRPGLYAAGLTIPGLPNLMEIDAKFELTAARQWQWVAGEVRLARRHLWTRSRTVLRKPLRRK